MHWDLQQLFRLHSKELLRFLRRRGASEENAADLMQDAFVRLAGIEPAGGAAVTNPRAYLFRISRNLSIDHARTLAIQNRYMQPGQPDDVADLTPSVETAIDFRQRVERLERVIAQLPERQREVFLLHKYEELSHSEIASRLGISKSMVEKHMIKALAYLRDNLTDLMK
ncbi:MAG: RNA polymerase sigma factor [Shinella sp.]|nr:RNA polymerase sigma factor [Shinella sp.]